MRLCAISDIHGHLPEIPDCDVLAIAGDICPIDGGLDDQFKWLRSTFGPWLVKLLARHIIPVGIAGNHDFIFERDPKRVESLGLPWVYLEDSGAEIFGHSFWGTPWTRWFAGWAFNSPEHHLDPHEDFLREKFRMIPQGTDVVISHGPPCGILDYVDRRNVGSVALTQEMERVMPTLSVFGHIHVAYGVKQIGSVTFCNASQVDYTYKLVNPPILFEL